MYEFWNEDANLYASGRLNMAFQDKEGLAHSTARLRVAAQGWCQKLYSSPSDGLKSLWTEAPQLIIIVPVKLNDFMCNTDRIHSVWRLFWGIYCEHELMFFQCSDEPRALLSMFVRCVGLTPPNHCERLNDSAAYLASSCLSVLQHTASQQHADPFYNPPAPRLVLHVWRLTCNHSSCHCHYWKSSCKTSRRGKAVITVQIIMLVSESWWPLTCSANSVSCEHCLPGDPSVPLGSMMEVGQENSLLLSGKVQ